MATTPTKRPVGVFSTLPKISVIWLAIPLVILLLTLFWKPSNVPSVVKNHNEETGGSSDNAANGFSYITHKKEDFGPMMHEIRSAVQSTVKDEIKTGKVTEVSISFELLDKGVGYTYGYTDWYWPASLLKITTLIAYLKQADIDSTYLERQLVFHKADLGYNQNFVKDSLTNGKKYTYRQLLERLIMASDNQACFALEQNIGEEKVTELYKDFTINVARGGKMQDFMPINQYMGILRSLYNATYLSRKYSEYALSLLTRSDFEYGIRGGIPPEVKVASKFGEKADRNDFQLHDCGIVYFQNQPYMLGVMTKGKDYNNMAHTIQRLSADIYGIMTKYEGADKNSSGIMANFITFSPVISLLRRRQGNMMF